MVLFSDCSLDSNQYMAKTTTWTYEQTRLAFYVYCQTPFGQLHQRNPSIITIANWIGRTPSALAMKCCNFASLDPIIRDSGRVGFGHASRQCRDIWEAFHADREGLVTECSQWLEKLRHEYDQNAAPPAPVLDDFVRDDYTGQTRQGMAQQRINQRFFRRAILSAYNQRCCVSGVSDTRLLVASHIVAWRDNQANRLNPGNGLCLSAMHDRAFDQHLFSLDDDYQIILSRRLQQTQDTFLQDIFWSSQGCRITLPERFRPDVSLLRKHRAIMLENEALDANCNDL